MPCGLGEIKDQQILMAKLSSYIRELKQARKITQNNRDFLKLTLFTVLYHLGNKWRFFNSNNYQRINCICNERKVTVEFRQNSGDIFTLHEILGTVPYRFPYQLLDQISAIVDLGAHIGLASLYFATLFPKAKLFSVEPVTDNFKLLKKNCEINGINSTLINKCMGSKKGTAKIHLDISSNKHSLLNNSHRTKVNSFIEVEMITMDDLIVENDIDVIDILKVDIEGAEAELFAECKSWISKVRLIIIEVHPPLVDYKKLIHTITSNGFHYFKPSIFDYDVFLREDIANKVKR